MFDDSAAGRRVPGTDRTPRGFNPWVAAALAFLLGMAITLWLARAEEQRAEVERHRAFADAARDSVASIRAQLSDCERLIRTFQSVFLASDEITEDEFHRVYENLHTDRARINLQALALAERRSVNGQERFITTMFVPEHGNAALRGLDVIDQPANLRSLHESRDTNLVSMSAPFLLRQSVGTGAAVDGFTLRLPVYAAGTVPLTVAARRRLMAGSLGASFRIRNLIDGVMPRAAGLVAEVAVDDVTEGTPSRLYERRLGPADSSRPQRHEIRFGGRIWRVEVRSAAPPPAKAWWASTFWFGAFASVLLAALSWSLMSTRERAITLGRAMSERFRASEERFRKLTELLPSLVAVARREDGELVYQNAAARDRLGHSEDGQRHLADLFGADALALIFDNPEGTTRAADVEMIDLASESFWASVCVSAIEIDRVPMWLIVASDISEQRLLTERLSYQASHDSLTRLLNRREFEARIGKALAAGSQAGALLFIDLDQFKLINDTSGHGAGDELLVQLAAMMRENLRPNDILGRLGGDEFGVLLSGVANVEAASHAAERLRRSLEGYVFSWEQRTYTTSASIGAVMLSRASTLKELFAHADAACYLAKEGGRNRVHFYSEDDAAITTRLSEMEWASRIADALREGRMLLDYQEVHAVVPQPDQKPHVELLLRLRAEDGREVMPGAFLPAAERYGLMPAIDRWVVETALTHLDQLHPSGGQLASCAINLSSASLEDASIFQLIEELIGSEAIDPGRLVFEITETVAMRDFASSSALISRLRELGCRVALDDFGAGMSSFGYMKNLALDIVKIDGSFVQELATDRMSQSIVRAVTEIGHQQGLQVVAEWVSSMEMMALLAQMGVDYAQGFALHKPERVLFQRQPQAHP
jgi:diguanylate cyclase (GGDEF)-like protein